MAWRPKDRKNPYSISCEYEDSLLAIAPELTLIELEEIEQLCDKVRAQARTRRFITYDCLFAKVLSSKEVKCSQGYNLRPSNKGRVPLVEILIGRSCRPCKNCTDFISVVGGSNGNRN